MSEIINLNKRRKAAAREAEKAKAAENRAAFGRTKAERDLEKARAEKSAARAGREKAGIDYETALDGAQ